MRSQSINIIIIIVGLTVGLNAYSLKIAAEHVAPASKLTRFNIKGNIIIDNSNRTLYRKSFSIHASEYYNSLPNEVKNAATIDCFKRNARCWIVKNVSRFKD